ncbi:MAG: aspartate aminotransferase family protein [Rhizobiales bacterium]|nr:aspartate aminotransferase family protein [Hyphomicrobiales bacterium]
MVSPALYNAYNRIPLTFVGGKGAWLTTDKGERYLDFGSGIAVNALGHAHPHLVQALQKQAEGIWHLSNLYDIAEQNRLADRLTAATFADRAFFVNSGAEAMECAIKTARRYHWRKGDVERNRIITFEGAFHGRTLATIAAGGKEKYLEGFGPHMDGFDQVPFGDHEALQAAINERTAAILIEPIQGEGGIRAVPPQCLRGLRELCDAHGLLLIFDEVQCGVGRTGTLFYHETAGIAPDLMAVAKGIGGGFPVGVCLANEEASTGITPGIHGTTYGGNPLAMAVGCAVLDVVLAEGFLDEVKRKGLLMKQKLAGLVDTNADVLEEVRGEGLLLGLKTRGSNMDFIAAARDHKLLTVPAGTDIMRVLPPLIVSEDEIDAALNSLEAACQAVRMKAA